MYIFCKKKFITLQQLIDINAIPKIAQISGQNNK